jgi:hypothetical protein
MLELKCRDEERLESINRRLVADLAKEKEHNSRLVAMINAMGVEYNISDTDMDMWKSKFNI